MCISIFIDLGANFNLATFGQGEGYAPSHSPSPLSNKCRLPRGKPALVAQGGGGMGGGHLPFLFAQDHASFSLSCGAFLACTCWGWTGLSTGCTEFMYWPLYWLY